MGFSFFLLILITAFFTGILVFSSMNNKKTDSYAHLETEEWDCPECGFHIQAGSHCIYCDTEKPA